jgi:signal transduction histidine kinase
VSKDAWNDADRAVAAFVEAAPDPLLAIDDRGTVVVAADATAELLGYKHGALAGKGVIELLPRLPTVTEASGVILVGRRRDGSEISLHVRRGSVQLSTGETLTVVAMRPAQGPLERRHESVHAERARAQAYVSAAIAHDLNNLLSVARVQLELARSDASRKLLSEIDASIQSMSLLVDALLRLSRRDSYRPRVLDLNDAVRRIEPVLRRLIGSGVELECHLEEGLRAVMADAPSIDQILLNLATNARDAMPDGGRLLVETSAHRGGVLLRISDSGIGMDDATRARAFEPYFSTKAAGEGTGLGLALVADIVMQMGGRIEVESEPGCGTTFVLELPCVP